MEGERATELTLIRHAPALTEGKLCGRTDVAADLADHGALSLVRQVAGARARVYCSPALRCQQTALALWPQATLLLDPRLWEQNFGAWEGMRYADLPDLGPLKASQLAKHRPPEGESFADVCRRIAPALRDIGAKGDAVIVAHAGTIRAALAMALRSATKALAFEVAPQSVTRIALLPTGEWTVGQVNWTPGLPS